MATKTKILIIRFSSIGDIVLTSNLVRCLKEQFQGDLELHYLIKKQYAPIMEANPYIDIVYAFEKNSSEIISDLKKEKYNYIVDLQKNARSFKIKGKIAAKTFTFNKLNVEKWFAVNFKSHSLPNIHIVDRYLEAVKSLGIQNDGKGLDYFIPEEEKIKIKDFPKNFSKGYIAFAIGAQHATKCLPVDKIIEICKKVELPVVLLGGKDDLRVAKFIEDKLDQKIWNACGKFSLHQSASIVSNASVVITHDTGLMHIAAAFKKKIVSIWGNTIPEFGMYPYLPKALKHYSKIIEIKELKCRPCSKIGFDKCPKGHFKCMKQIQEDNVVDQVFDLLQMD